MTISRFLVAGAIGLVVAYALTPLVEWAAIRVGALAQPGGRHIHRVPVPRLGGIGVYLAFLVAVLAGLPLERSVRITLEAHHVVLTVPFTPQFDRPVIGVLCGATLITILGIIDDIWGVSPMEKLFGQLVAAIVPLSFGVGMDVLTNPLGGMLFLGPFGLALTVAWIVALCNVMNLIDGIDGLATGIAAIAGGTVLIASYQRGDAGTAMLAAAFVGSTLGFLPYNFNPARIFLGDSGSMLLGYLLGSLSVLGTYKSYTALSLLVPLAALGVPVFDTALAIARRWRTGRPIFQADTEHLHHRLLQRGLSQRQTAVVLYLVTGVLGAGALLASGVHRFALVAVLGALLAALAFGARRTGLLTPPSPSARGRTEVPR
ncbi:MAG TPA: MraY family glycosyltransferase [bacterium]|nr:MraY family glycosyltransferase [bacterium]